MPYISRLRVSKRMLFTLLAVGAYSGFMYLQAQDTGIAVKASQSRPAAEMPTDSGDAEQVNAVETGEMESIDQSAFTRQETNRQRADVTGEREFSRDMEIEGSSLRGTFQGNPEPYTQVRRREQYPVASYSAPATDYRAIAAGSVQISGISVGSTTGRASGSRGEQVASAPVEAEPRELTPEEINPFLPDGSVAEDTTDGNRQAKIECPTFITGNMKTRYSYELLESMGCGPGFNY